MLFTSLIRRHRFLSSDAVRTMKEAFQRNSGMPQFLEEPGNTLTQRFGPQFRGTPFVFCVVDFRDVNFLSHDELLVLFAMK